VHACGQVYRVPMLPQRWLLCRTCVGCPSAARGPARFRSDWRNQYWCLPRIMARFPDADGFLWTNDDVMLNYWNLLQADKTKLWLPNDPHSSEVRHFPFDDTTDMAVPVSNCDLPQCQ